MDLGSYTYSVEISRSIRKSITLKVSDKYSLKVKCPFFVLDDAVFNFIESRTKWINKQSKLFLDTQIALSDQCIVPFLGNTITIVKSDSHKKTELSHKSLYIPSNKDLKQEVITWFKEQAKLIIPMEVEKFSSAIGVEYNRIYIKDQKTRWGSCSSKGNLNFNWKILLTNTNCLKYLVIHELCHLLEMNHSHKFWNLVSLHDPNYLSSRRELKKSAYYLTL